MTPKIRIAPAIVTAVLLLASCGSGDHKPAPTTTTTTQAPDAKAASSTKDYLNSFRDASWFPRVKSIEPSGTLAVVKTDLPADSSSADSVKQICSAVSGYIYGNNQKALNGVKVESVDGRALVTRAKPTDSCQPQGLAPKN